MPSIGALFLAIQWFRCFSRVWRLDPYEYDSAGVRWSMV